VRWVVERTISWIKGLRRMHLHFDRSAISIDAWTTIAAAFVCLNILMEAVSETTTFDLPGFLVASNRYPPRETRHHA
jgi:hypothetical protein